jgi:hypothetical protein
MLFNRTSTDQPAINPGARSIHRLRPNRVEIAPPKPPSRSVIGAHLKITGDLHSDRDVQVDGQVEGDVRCTQLIVAKDGTINGNILADWRNRDGQHRREPRHSSRYSTRGR